MFYEELSAKEKQWSEQLAFQREDLAWQKDYGTQKLTLERDDLAWQKDYGTQKLTLERELGTRGLDLQEKGLEYQHEYQTGMLGVAQKELSLKRSATEGQLSLERAQFDYFKKQDAAQPSWQSLMSSLPGRSSNFASAGNILSDADYAQKYYTNTPVQQRHDAALKAIIDQGKKSDSFSPSSGDYGQLNYERPISYYRDLVR